MRIVIDLQGAQSTGSRNRGIGRYSLSLAQAIVRNRGEHDVIIALSDLFPDTIESIRGAFEGLLPQENIRVWSAVEPVSYMDKNNDWRRQSAELVREGFLASLKPNIILITSLFEGYGDAAVTSVRNFTKNIPTAVILYDLIPYIYRKPYLENPLVETWYLEKIEHLRRADLLFAISESSRQEGIDHLGFPKDRSINISTDADAHFKPQTITAETEHTLRQHYGLQRTFLMYTGGIDHRKNIERLIRAFSKLPNTLRQNYQLAIVCAVNPESRGLLEELAAETGLSEGELVLTGFVPEDHLLALYSLCSLFVFPSWHEGFGLPALEAMRCGAPVIAANTSSLPEVIGWDQALFDPYSDEAMAAAIERALLDEAFRMELIRNGKKQSLEFSWNESALRTLSAMEQLHVERAVKSNIKEKLKNKLKLAFVSPLPPERSGIADFSAELIPELARFYEIDVIVTLDEISDPWIKANCSVKSVEWFIENSDKYDRVLYQFGNSSFHQHMFSLLKEIPGVVILHDFFLSNILQHMEHYKYQLGAWTNALYLSHGYKALKQRFNVSESVELSWIYPCNIEVLENALGVMVHSEHSRRLANYWYRPETGDDWAVIPLLRVANNAINKPLARRQLNLDNNVFLVCSFGLIGPPKLNHRLLNAWLQSTLARNPNCLLMFVGENHEGKYGEDLITRIRESGLDDRIRIAGWTDSSTFQYYLAAADIGVQLRQNSRGETSAAVLDCMNYGLPTIVNAHGSMADLPDDGVWKISDQFSDIELVSALERLSGDKKQMQPLGERAQQLIHTLHDPYACSNQYAQAIEGMYHTASIGICSLTNALSEINNPPDEQTAWTSLANSIAQSIPNKVSPFQLFVDISEVVINDHKTGVQRVVRSILLELLINPPAGYRIEPVYGDTNGGGYRYARKYTLQMLDCPDSILKDDIIEFKNGDIFLGLDFYHRGTLAHDWFYQKMRNYGVKVFFIIYDLLPVIFPHFWEAHNNVHEIHHEWLKVLSKTDGVICISNAVAEEFTEWLKTYGAERSRPLKIKWFHLGADIDASRPSKGISDESSKVLNLLDLGHSFLMVGTLEPRKGYAQVLAAFEQLWGQGVAINLVIVGKQGWLMETLAEKLHKHPKLGSQLFWLKDVSDEFLEEIYAHTTCLIAASEGEGFGLPLIEAAKHKLPIIARDIPVFKEVAGVYAYYFLGLSADNLAQAIISWLSLYRDNQHPKSEAMPWLTWKQSTQQLLNQILG